MRPRIGVTRGQPPISTYQRALESAGVEVLSLSPDDAGSLAPEALLAGLDGIVFTGGNDIDPAVYGAVRHPTVVVNADRDALELPLARAALRAPIPVLGICRGIQVLNVAAGGTLWQDIPAERPGDVRHKEPEDTRDRRRLLHSVDAVDGSLVQRMAGQASFAVNSIHHQAVREVAPGMRVTAVAPDGVVEALERPGGPFFLAVQWHPEELWQADAAAARLFRAFADACRRDGVSG